LAEKVQAADKQINQMERQIDEELVRILARRQPAASDLRFIIAIGKSITDLERIGDEAAKVARYALALTEEGESPRGYAESRHIGNQVRVMVHDALDAFARFDAELAFRVMQDDNVIDAEYKTALRALMTYMMEDPRSISRVLNVMWVLRSLERIGDHARNISEQLIFLVKGSDVRHTSYDEVERQLNLKKQ
jgi:phosphate transport system protein